MLLGMWGGRAHQTPLQQASTTQREPTGHHYSQAAAGKRPVAELVGQSSATYQAPITDPIFEIRSLALSEDSPRVSGSIDHNPWMITVDTGSTISIVRSDVLPKEKQQELQPAPGLLKTVTGKKIPFRGRGEMTVSIGSTQSRQWMWVADIQDECILGMDFLKSHHCLIDFQDDSLQIDDEEIPLQRVADAHQDTAQTCFRAILEATIDLPPNSESIVSARVDGLSHNSSRWGLSEPSTGQPDGVLTGRTLVDLRKPTVPVRLMNLTEKSLRVKKGSVMAYGEPVQSVFGPFLQALRCSGQQKGTKSPV